MSAQPQHGTGTGDGRASTMAETLAVIKKAHYGSAPQKWIAVLPSYGWDTTQRATLEELARADGTPEFQIAERVDGWQAQGWWAPVADDTSDYDEEPVIDDAPPVGDAEEQSGTEPHTESTDQPGVEPELGIDGVAFTIFTKNNGPLTKSIKLDADGKLVSDSSECDLARGCARRAFVKSLGEFADLISALGQNEAIGLGQLLADLPDDVAVVTEAKLNGGSAIARTAKYITHRKGEPAFLLIDHDTKGMPDEVHERLSKAGGFWPALVSVCPPLAKVGRVVRASTSAGLYRTDTGEKLKGSDGQHTYLVIHDGSDAVRFLKDLHARCVIAGLGWATIGEAGQFLERSIVDRTVGRPERLVFEGKPVLTAPLEQDAEVRRARAFEGGVLDTSAWVTLTDAEKSKLAKAHAKERARLGDEANRKRDAFVKQHGGTRSARMMCDGILLPDIVLPFDDPKFNGVTVGAVLEDPARYDGATLADPIEGVAYGRCKAKVMRRDDGTPFIHSLAHGTSTIYELRYDAKERLRIKGADRPETTRGLAELLKPRLYSDGSGPAKIFVNGEGQACVIHTGEEMTQVEAHQVCQPMSYDPNAGKWTSVTLPRTIAEMYLRGLTEEERGLRPLRGITQSPILDEGGGIRTAQGYDAGTGLFCHCIPQVIVPDRPTKQEATRAFRYLRHYFRTFPWGDSIRVAEDGLSVDVVDLSQPVGMDESTFLTALMTGVCRPCLDLAPGVLFDAPNISGSGSGKGLLLRSTAAIGAGVRPIALTAGHNAEEMDKRLVAALREKRPFLYLDNYNAKTLQSDTLSSALTEDPCEVRILGQGKNVKIYTKTFICITGNGVLLAEDMLRRILKIVLDAHMENPEQRRFTGDFLEDVWRDRIELLQAVLTIWRWGRQDKIDAGKPLGSYGTWSRWCRDPLLALGCKDPVDRIAELKAADPRRQAVIQVFEKWWSKHGSNTITTSELDDEVRMLIDPKARRQPDSTLLYNKNLVAGYVSRHVGTTLGGFVLEAFKDTSHYRHQMQYRLRQLEGVEEPRVAETGVAEPEIPF